MKKLGIFAVLTLMLAGLPGFAQTKAAATTPATTIPTSLQFAMQTQPVMAVIGGSKFEAGVDAVGTLAISPSFAARTDNFDFPGPGIVLNTAGAQYSNGIKNTEFSYSLNAGVGMVSSPAPMHFAANAGGTLLFSPTGEPKVQVVILSVQYLHGGIVDGPLSTSNFYTVATGLQIDLSKVF